MTAPARQAVTARAMAQSAVRKNHEIGKHQGVADGEPAKRHAAPEGQARRS